MIVCKTWERHNLDAGRTYRDVYKGWFLLGFIPLYITRERYRR